MKVSSLYLPFCVTVLSPVTPAVDELQEVHETVEWMASLSGTWRSRSVAGLNFPSHRHCNKFIPYVNLTVFGM